MWVYPCASSSCALRRDAASRSASIESDGVTLNTTSQSWFARQGSPEVLTPIERMGGPICSPARDRPLGRSLFAFGPVQALPEEVGVTVMARVLGDDLHEAPPEGPPFSRAGLVQGGDGADGRVRAVALTSPHRER